MSLSKVFSYLRAEFWAVRASKAQKTQLKGAQQIANQIGIEFIAI